MNIVLIINLVLIIVVFTSAWIRLGIVSAFGITAAVWLLIPYAPRQFRE